MAGTQLVIDTHEVERIARRVHELSGLDKHALLDALGFEVENQSRRRIEEAGGGPAAAETDLGKWPEWSTRYARKRHAGQSLLTGEGDLHDSLQHLVVGNEVQVGSNLPYAAIQQFGGAEVGRPGHPPRPYLGLSSGNEAELVAIVEDFLREALA